MTNALGYELTKEQQNVIAAVKGLRAAQGISVSTLCKTVHVARATMFNRLNDGEFNVPQLAALAKLFNVSVQDLFDGMRLTGQQGSVPEVTPKLASSRGKADGSAIGKDHLALVRSA